MSIFKGYATALITPFTDDGKSINFNALEKLLDFQLKNDADAIVLLGTTGEPATMTTKEKEDLVKFCVRFINHKIPVIVGAGSNDTATACKYAKRYETLGADALLVVTPYYNKCTQAGLIAHYTEIAKNTTLPLILYNVPSRTGVNMLSQTVAELSKVQNIVAIKEASGNVEQVMEIRRLCNDDFDIYSGDDALTLPILSVGGSGVITVAGNIVPNKMHELCNAYFGKANWHTNSQIKNSTKSSKN